MRQFGNTAHIDHDTRVAGGPGTGESGEVAARGSGSAGSGDYELSAFGVEPSKTSDSVIHAPSRAQAMVTY